MKGIDTKANVPQEANLEVVAACVKDENDRDPLLERSESVPLPQRYLARKAVVVAGAQLRTFSTQASNQQRRCS